MGFRSSPNPAQALGSGEMAIDRIIRKPELLRVTGVSIASIYRWVASGTFPSPVKLGPGSVGWRETEIREWLDNRDRAFEVPGVRKTQEIEAERRGTLHLPNRGECGDGSR